SGTMPALPAPARGPVPVLAGEPVPAHLLPWVQLAQQLLQTPGVRSVLGSALDHLTGRPDATQFVVGLATGVLTTAEGQSALRDLATGAMDSNRFLTLFANRVRSLLEMHGHLPRSN
ncbi:MAG: hypothetical protein DIU70_010575, partial [Bacillota bacterium]